MTRLEAWTAVLVFLTIGCAGKDFIRETLPARVEISPGSAAIQIGGVTGFKASYIDGLGTPVGEAAFTWSSANPAVATIDQTGRASGVHAGQTMVYAASGGVISPPAMLTVVVDPNQIASVVVGPAGASVSVGETQQFDAVARSLSGDVIAGVTFAWGSSDGFVATIDAGGLARAIAPGSVQITASAAGVTSAPVALEVRGGSRTGIFMHTPGSGEIAGGTATLRQQTDGRLVLSFGSDFFSSSGPDLRVFLSHDSRPGSTSLSLGSLKSLLGEQSYDVPAGVGLSDFDYVIVQCVPFNITFGFALLQ